jgi:hypothetical protein
VHSRNTGTSLTRKVFATFTPSAFRIVREMLPAHGDSVGPCVNGDSMGPCVNGDSMGPYVNGDSVGPRVNGDSGTTCE